MLLGPELDFRTRLGSGSRLGFDESLPQEHLRLLLRRRVLE